MCQAVLSVIRPSRVYSGTLQDVPLCCRVDFSSNVRMSRPRSGANPRYSTRQLRVGLCVKRIGTQVVHCKGCKFWVTLQNAFERGYSALHNCNLHHQAGCLSISARSVSTNATHSSFFFKVVRLLQYSSPSTCTCSSSSAIPFPTAVYRMPCLSPSLQTPLQSRTS